MRLALLEPKTSSFNNSPQDNLSPNEPQMDSGYDPTKAKTYKSAQPNSWKPLPPLYNMNLHRRTHPPRDETARATVESEAKMKLKKDWYTKTPKKSQFKKTQE